MNIAIARKAELKIELDVEGGYARSFLVTDPLVFYGKTVSFGSRALVRRAFPSALGVFRVNRYNPNIVAQSQTRRQSGFPRNVTYLDGASGVSPHNLADLMFVARIRDSIGLRYSLPGHYLHGKSDRLFSRIFSGLGQERLPYTVERRQLAIREPRHGVRAYPPRQDSLPNPSR